MKSRAGGWLGKEWWAGLGVILAAVLAVIGFYLSSSGSSTYSNHGSCVAQGNDNTVNCPGTGSGKGP
jgi:hypothetical protein